VAKRSVEKEGRPRKSENPLTPTLRLSLSCSPSKHTTAFAMRSPRCLATNKLTETSIAATYYFVLATATTTTTTTTTRLERRVRDHTNECPQRPLTLPRTNTHTHTHTHTDRQHRVHNILVRATPARSREHNTTFKSRRHDSTL
jgi:hypothetical protein